MILFEGIKMKKPLPDRGLEAVFYCRIQTVVLKTIWIKLQQLFYLLLLLLLLLLRF